MPTWVEIVHAEAGYVLLGSLYYVFVLYPAIWLRRRWTARRKKST